MSERPSPVNTKTGPMILLIILIISVLALACTAARPVNGLATSRSYPSGVLVTPSLDPLALQKEINEQNNESNGIILASVVIVLIIIGGTFAATRRKDQ